MLNKENNLADWKYFGNFSKKSKVITNIHFTHFNKKRAGYIWISVARYIYKILMSPNKVP